MGKKLYYFLLIILALNALRYGIYLIEDGVEPYSLTMFIINLIPLIIMLFYKNKPSSNNDGFIRNSPE